jgi:putative membrane protein
MSDANEISARARGVARSTGRRAGAWGRASALASIGIGFALTSLGALADEPGQAGYAHHGMWGGGWGGMLLGFFMMLLVIAAIAAAVILVARVLGGANLSSAKPSGQTPLDILEQRFAQGEIDTQEFEERRRALAKGSN